MSFRNINIYAIAEEAGVSIATVSRVMNNSPSVSDAMRERVMQVVNRYHYVPSSAAKSLSTRTSNMIAVIIPDLKNQFYARLLAGIGQIAGRQKAHMCLFCTDGSAKKELDVLFALRQYRPMGVLAALAQDDCPVETAKRLHELEQHNIPVVLMDQALHEEEFSSVTTDDAQGACKAVCQLIAAGHRKIAIMAGLESSFTGTQRKKGYLQAMYGHDLPVPEEYVCMAEYRADLACAHIHRLLALPDPPTAVFSANNTMTLGCLKAFHELHIRLGRDISMIGFDDIEVLNWMGCNVSVVARDECEMGRCAARLLMERLDAPEGIKQKNYVVIPAELILRGSEKRIE